MVLPARAGHLRRFSEADRRHILAEADTPGASLSEVARRYGIARRREFVTRPYFWLSDDQFARLEPYLPTDTRGVPRVDDRRVISGIVHVLGVVAGPTHLQSMGRERPSITGSRAGARIA